MFALTQAVREICQNLSKIMAAGIRVKFENPPANDDEIKYLVTDALLSQIGPMPEFLRNYMESEIFSEMLIHETSWLTRNPYFQQVGDVSAVSGNLTLGLADTKAWTIYPYDIGKKSKVGIRTPQIAIFRENIKYQTVAEDGETWMSIAPSEIITMEPNIEHAHGNVLTIGCGLGYFAFAVAQKQNTSQVTIVEKNPHVIKLFEENILPRFAPEIQAKIKIKQADGLEYLDNTPDGQFDYCFADIWKSNADMEPFLRCKAVGNKFQKTTVEHWIEDALVYELSETAKILAHVEIANAFGIPEPEPRPLTQGAKNQWSFIKELTRPIKIESANDVQEKLSEESIKHMLTATNLQELVNRHYTIN